MDWDIGPGFEIGNARNSSSTRRPELKKVCYNLILGSPTLCFVCVCVCEREGETLLNTNKWNWILILALDLRLRVRIN